MQWGIPRWVIFFGLFTVLVTSTGYFVFKSYITFDRVVEEISGIGTSAASELLSKVTISTAVKIFELKARTALEADTTLVRHKRATSALITRTWLRFMSSSFGAILVAIGAFFVLGQVTAGTTTIDGTWESAKFSLVVSSPGLLFAILGVVLITVPIVSTQVITSNDTASFYNKVPAIAKIAGSPPGETAAVEGFCKENPKASGCSKTEK